jgi:hypothetical protein
MSDATDYRDYRPLVLQDASLETLRGEPYRRFVLSAAIVPGVRMLLARHRARRDWPYIDTKFNPNTGQDLPAERYRMLHTWFLGRATQSLAEHLDWLERLEDLSAPEREEANALFGRLIGNMAAALRTILEKNHGRVPFRVNLDLEAVDADGNRIEADPDRAGAGDVFGAKGLIAEGSDANVELGIGLLLVAGGRIRDGRYDFQQYAVQPKGIAQSGKMLLEDAARTVFAATTDPQRRAQVLDLCADLLAEVLDRHYDPATAVFSEYLDEDSGRPGHYLDPGHAAELVGLGLGAVECMRAQTAWLNDERKALIRHACRELPRLLVKATELGFNSIYPGLFKAVDNRTGEPINDEMPWWNLPETMRAAVRAYEVSDDEPVRTRCLQIVQQCHNAYFQHYLNRDKMLFPYQTISGRTGKVLDQVPAVPEGDPLYHTNLALLDMLDVLGRL